jgi:hypothetical protein
LCGVGKKRQNRSRLRSGKIPLLTLEVLVFCFDYFDVAGDQIVDFFFVCMK